MYKVIIVDDEPWILEGIQSTFEWNKYDMEVVGSFTNARQALEAIAEKKAEILFTDIRMPGMSGLALMEELRRREEDMEIVIISGYSDFQYAQQAIRNGAFDYCLKPIKEEATDDLLSRLKERLDEKLSRKMKLLVDFADNEEDREASFIGLSSKYPYYQAIAADTSSGDFVYKTLGKIPNMEYSSMSAGRKHYVIINCIRDISDCFREYGGQGVIGISGTDSFFHNVSTLMTQARIAAASPFITGEEGSYVYRPVRQQELQALMIRIIHLINDHQRMNLQTLIRDLPAVWRENGFTVEDICWFWNRLSVHGELSAFRERPYSDFEPLEWQQLGMRFEDMEDLCQTLMNNLLCLQQDKTETEDPDTSFDKLLSYLHQNFDKQLQLKELASRFYINKSYASVLFRKTAGVSFTEYLNKLRMDKARELLLKSSLPIAQVAEQSGYVDYFYFSKLFRKTFGVTPSMFRKEPAAVERAAQ